MTNRASSASHPPGGAGPAASAGRPGDLLSLIGVLTERDRRLIDVLTEHQVLTTDQLAALAFPSLDTAQHRLLRLHRLGVVDRFRWNPTAGSATWHYTLGPAGAALAAAARGAEPPRPSELRRRAARLATSPRLGHLLGVNGFFCGLGSYARTHPGTTLAAWWSERRCAEHYGQIVRPDGYGAWVEDGQRTEFFVEHDTGTEPLGRLVAKLPAYADLVTAGGPAHPVFFWLPSTAREAHLRRLLDERRATVAVATAAAELARALGASPAGPIWLPVGSGRRRCLIDLAAVSGPPTGPEG
jgi:hypothetical protein